jgi:hypothetical protein
MLHGHLTNVEKGIILHYYTDLAVRVPSWFSKRTSIHNHRTEMIRTPLPVNIALPRADANQLNTRAPVTASLGVSDGTGWAIGVKSG